MEEYVRKYFWLFPVVVVMLCGILAAKAVNHIAEEKLLADAKTPPKVEVSARTAAPKETRGKGSEAFVKRNMFCSECIPPEPVAEAGQEDLGHPPFTSLPLRLVATNVSTIPEYSMVTVMNTSTERQGAYAVGQEIPDAGIVEVIGTKFVDFRNQSSRRLERIALLNDAPPPRPVAARTPTPIRPSSPRDELTAMMDEGVKKVDDNTYELDKGVVEKVLENPMAVARGARIVPSVKDGKANGFKLYAIRPSSVYAKLGLRNGDTIHSINGYELSSPDKALEVYTKLREASNLSVTATRRGKQVKLNYSIR